MLLNCQVQKLTFRFDLLVKILLSRFMVSWVLSLIVLSLITSLWLPVSVFLCSTFYNDNVDLLFDNSQQEWTRLVTEPAKLKFGTELTYQELEATLIMRHYACTKPGCLQPGQTALKCGVCEKGTTEVKTTPTHAQKAAKIAARTLFDAANASLPENERYKKFIQEQPQWDFNALKSTASAVSSKVAGLTYIFLNQEKIELPFALA